MEDASEKIYDVFISYAHADVKDPVTGAVDPDKKALIEKIKLAIEEALREEHSDHPFAFLDSEALQWGMEWNARICACIGNCRVFVYLLSPNYLRSDYCQRERLWWAQREMARGRLHKATKPVYYINLAETGDPVVDQYIRELLVCQADDQPFFQSLEQVREDIVEDRLCRIKEGIKGHIRSVKAAEKSLCTIFPPVSKYFVGRLKELADLNQRCCETGKIPVISGPAGVGKSELAVAYAYAYAENFPQGRFLIPMQGVTDWTTALDKMVGEIKICLHGRSLEAWGLPENFEKQPPEERRRIAWDWLCRRTDEGALLLLLDNLEELALLSESALGELSFQRGIPEKLKIIATTRLNEHASSSRSVLRKFEVGALKENDALELFCQIGDNVFPFARCPMENGKLLIDKRAANPAADPELAENEYAALKKIIGLLGGHAWSLEIIAGFMALNYKRCSFQEKWKALNENPLEALRGRTLRNGNDVQYPELLLGSTLDQLRKYDELDENFGRNILRLAAVASFFPPEQVPEDALKGIWKQEFGEKMLSWDDGMQSASSGTFALELLKRYRVVNGDGPLLKMHRLTRGVLQSRFAEDEKPAIIEAMRKYLDAFLENTPQAASNQLMPWLGGVREWLESFKVLWDNEAFLCTVAALANQCAKNDIFEGMEILLKRLLRRGRETGSGNLTAKTLNTLANFHADLNRLDEAEAEYAEALKIRRQLAAKDPEKYNRHVAITLNNLANLHNDLNRLDEAEAEHAEALKIRRQLAAKDPEKYDPDVAMSLYNLANLHSDRNRLDEAEAEHVEALKIRRQLAKKAPEKYSPDVSASLCCLAILHSTLNRLDEAEAEHAEALEIDRQLAKKVPEKYETYVAISLATLANFHGDLDRMNEAEAEYVEALKIERQLAQKAPERYDSIVAATLNGLANLHKRLGRSDEAETEYAEALAICRKLVKKAPEKYGSSVATALNNLANLHSDLDRLDEAEAEYGEALKIRRQLAEKAPEKYDPDVATALNNLANLHEKRDRLDEAEAEYAEALEIYRKLAEKNPEKYDSDMANTLYNLAYLHKRIDRFDEAETEYAEALKIYRKLAGKDPERYIYDVADTLGELGNVHSNRDRPDEAEAEYVEALRLYRELAEKVPEKYDSDMAVLLYNLALLHKGLDRLDEAEAVFVEALTIFRKLAGEAPGRYNPDVADTLDQLAGIRKKLKRFSEAEAAYLEALELRERTTENTSEKYAADAESARFAKDPSVLLKLGQDMPWF